MSDVKVFEPKFYQGTQAQRLAVVGSPGDKFYATDKGINYDWNAVTSQWDDITNNRVIGLGRLAPLIGTTSIAWLAIGFPIFEGTDFVGVPTKVVSYAGYLGGPVSNVDMQILDITNATTIWQSFNIGPAGILVCSPLANLSPGRAFWQIQMQAVNPGTQFGGGELHLIKEL